MELGCVPENMDEYFHWGPIFYVCSSERDWRVSFMYKGIYYIIYYIRNSLLGVATLDVWSSETRTFQPKKRVPRNDQFLFILYQKMSFWSFWSSPKGTPPRPVQKNYEKTILQWKPMELGGVPEKFDEYFHWGPVFYVCSSARNKVSSMYKGI